MNTHYTPIKMFLAFAIVAGSLISSAQQLAFLNANNINAGFGIGGNLFTKFDSQNNTEFGALEVPKGSGMRPMFTTGLWLSAVDAGSNLHCAAQRYRQNGPDFYDGPIASSYNAAYDTFYKRVFKITRSQIVHHQGLGVNVPVGQIDSAVLFWPAKGNMYVLVSYGVSITSHLAPFVDVDMDGSYDPSKGDYPDICGTEAIFFVFNDVRGPHHETGGSSLGVEVRGLAEVFVDQVSSNAFEKRALNNTVFVSYEIENKSANPLFNFYTGLYEDIDLGCFSNDRAGCDSNRSMIFVYNGTMPDPDCNGVMGYKQYKIATGTKFLRGDLNVSGYFTNGAIAAQSDPANCTQYRNYLTGYWNDGTPFTAGNDGYGGVAPVKYIFPGDPNNPVDWTEVSPGAALTAGDRRIFGSGGPSGLLAGETKLFDLAFLTSYDSTANNLTIVDTLKRDAQFIQSFYNSSLLGCRANHSIPLRVSEANKETLELRVYPNPASGLLSVESGADIDLAEMTDILGRTVLTKAGESKKLSIDVSSLSHGLYLLKIKAGNKTALKKVVVE